MMPWAAVEVSFSRAHHGSMWGSSDMDTSSRVLPLSSATSLQVLLRGGGIICGLSLPQGIFLYASLILEFGAGRDNFQAYLHPSEQPTNGGRAEGWPRPQWQMLSLGTRSPCQVCRAVY